MNIGKQKKGHEMFTVIMTTTALGVLTASAALAFALMLRVKDDS